MQHSREFKRLDDDYDGLLLRHLAEELLQGHCRDQNTRQNFQEAEIDTALEIADVRGTCVLDLCTTICAAIIARVLSAAARRSPRTCNDTSSFCGVTEVSELVPLLLDKLFMSYGDKDFRTVDTRNLLEQLRNNVGRDFELYASVSYDEVLEPFAESCIDQHALVPELIAHAGRGSPLAYVNAEEDCSEDCDGDDQDSCFDPFSFPALQSFFGGALESCGINYGEHRQNRGFRIFEEITR